jgi:hypothetical protein
VNTTMNLRVPLGGVAFLDQPSNCQFLKKDSAPLSYSNIYIYVPLSVHNIKSAIQIRLTLSTNT